MDTTAMLYLELLKRCLTRVLVPDGSVTPELVFTPDFDLKARTEGRDWPTEAVTMVGLKRLDNLEQCIRTALRDNTPGDLVEAGVWRGGAAIFMRAVLAAFQEPHRKVWVADSFQGLPKADPKNFPQDGGDRHHELSPYLAVALDEVRSNFRQYGLLDDRVRFLAGWFKDSLPRAQICSIAVLRIDCDMYESTTQVLTNLYPKLSPGGFVIVDDYGALAGCRAAVDDFRRSSNITEELRSVDWTGIYWQKANCERAAHCAADSAGVRRETGQALLHDAGSTTAELRAEHHRLQQDYQASRDECQRLRSALAAAQQALSGREQESVSSAEQLRNAIRQLDDMRLYATELTTQLGEAGRRLEHCRRDFVNSWSWRLTSPLRVIGRLFAIKADKRTL